MSKLQFHLGTIALLKKEIQDESTKRELDSVADSIAHMAPEIIDRAWQKIFNLCSIRMNDANDNTHQSCNNIYNTRFTLYKKQQFA
jgi:hypothetical protein